MHKYTYAQIDTVYIQTYTLFQIDSLEIGTALTTVLHAFNFFTTLLLLLMFFRYIVSSISSSPEK